MKIIQISFSNINNLKGGPHIISFDTSPLSTAGIFAILGPTGSGKSTILDVITLALFNRIPRFKKTITKGEMIGNGSVMTHHTSFAQASITYEVNGLQYTSEWSIAKTKKGNLKEYEMAISDQTGKYIVNKRSDVPQKNEEIIGLKYDQFLKSIILSQGEFSKFLKANKNERGKLLENITGTGIYRELGKEAFQKHKEVKEKVARLNDILDSIEVLSEEKRSEIKETIHTTEKEAIKTNKEYDHLAKSRSIKQELNNLNKGISEQTEKLTKLVFIINDFKPKRIKLENHYKINHLQGEFSIYQNTLKKQQYLIDAVKKTSEKLEQNQHALKYVLSEATSLTQNDITEKNIKSTLARLEKDIIELDNSRDSIKSKGQEARVRINRRINESNIELSTNIQAIVALNLLSSNEVQLLQTIKKGDLHRDDDILQTQNVIANKKDTLEQLNKYIALEVTIIDLQAHQKDEEEKSVQYQKSISETIPIKEKNESTLQVLKKHSQNLQNLKESSIKLSSLSELRKELKDGEPCSLCGSLQHPYSMHSPEDKEDRINLDISLNKEDIRKKEHQLSKITHEFTTAKTSLKISEKIIKDDITRIDNLHSQLDALKRPSNISISETIESTQKLAEDLAEEIKRKDKAIIAIQHLRLNTELISDYKYLDQTSKKYKEVYAYRKQLFEGENITATCNHLNDEFNKIDKIVHELKTGIQVHNQDLQHEEITLEKSKTILQGKLSNFECETIQQLQDLLLSEEAVQLIKDQSDTLTKSETEIDTKLASLKADFDRQTGLDKYPEITLEDLVLTLKKVEERRNELNKLIGGKTVELKKDEELILKRSGRAKELSNLNEELEKWSLLNNMIGDATGNKFANFAQGLTLQNLLVYTNRRLSKLSDRYLLAKPKLTDKKEEGDFLQVIDSYQGNTERAVNTLSGGETFLISLALALSLSDMASRNVSINSIFIDEGFSTLDHETLDIALDTLEKLQTESQKTVGIISHVDALKERINVQIRLVKDAQGYSQIKIEA